MKALYKGMPDVSIGTEGQSFFHTAWTRLLLRGRGLGVLVGGPGSGKTEALARAIRMSGGGGVSYFSKKVRIPFATLDLLRVVPRRTGVIVLDEAQQLTKEARREALRLSEERVVWLVGLPSVKGWTYRWLAERLLSGTPFELVDLSSPTLPEVREVAQAWGVPEVSLEDFRAAKGNLRTLRRLLRARETE